MKIVVSKDIVKIENNHSENHYGEYNVNECTFQFDDYFNNVSVKRAVFTSRIDNKSIEVDVINNKCIVPSEILENVYDEVTLGVYGYELSGEELLVRYSPTPDKFVVHDGSYKENAEHPEIITPTQYDIYSQALQEGLDRVDDKLVDVEKQGDYANTQGNYAKEQGDYAKEQGTNAKNVADDTQKKAEDGKFNGKSLEFIWQGTKLGVRLEGQEEYQFVDLQGVQGEIGATGEPFKIKKTYASVSEMNADFRNMAFGDYVMIASSVNVEDNAKLYTRGESAWIFISDFSGAMGIRGETGLTPNIKIGEVKTLEAGSQAKVTRSGSNEEPVFNFELPKGDKGDDYVLTEEDKVEIGEKVNTEYEQRIAENEKDIIDIESYLDSLTPKATEKGELVHITDALNLPTFETKTSGNVKQETTKGQQLFNKDLFDNFHDNIKFVTLQLKPNTDYTLSSDIPASDGTIANVFIITSSGSPTTANNGVLPNNPRTITSLDDGIIRIGYRDNDGSLSDEKNKYWYMLNEGATALPYEKYTGGQASPNPEFPQEVEVLEGYNLFDKNNANILYDTYIGTGGNVGSSPTNNILYLEIKPNTSYTIQKISSNRFRVGTYNSLDIVGKTLNNIIQNLRDNTTIHTLRNTTDKYLFFQYKGGDTNEQEILDSIVISEGIDKKSYIPYGYISYKNNGNNWFNDNKFVKDNFNNVVEVENGYTFDVIKNKSIYTIEKAKPNTQYIFKGRISSSIGADLYIHFNYTDGTKKFGVEIIKSGAFDTTFNLTTDGTKTLQSIEFSMYGYGDYKTYTFKDFMLSENDDDYEPYQEQIVPLDLKGNWVGATKYAEDLLVTDKKYLWLVKNVGKYTFNGNETGWVESTSENTILVFLRTGAEQKDITYDGLYSNLFINKNIYNNNEQGFYLSKTGNFVFRIKSDLLPDGINDFQRAKTYLVENNCYFYYPLIEPQIIELGELPEPIKTFEGVNNIQVLANLDTEIEVKYALDLKKYYDNKLAEISAQII